MKKLSRVKDGEGAILFQVAGFEPIRCSLDEVSGDIKHRLAMHGMSQKIGDSAAGSEGQEAYDSIISTWNTLKDGKWAERVSTGGGEKISISAIKQALSLLSPEERSAAIAAFAKQGKNIV